ncbi:MAG: Asp-tRNA(Asn)/Glu-tRNA(Gln) amidotransferase subunit GatB [Sphingobacteriales bacterium]|nr:MAG: Asp-tRNA(Asn)/Glu-tRNA(Gln) amidotransferase subunit GatB [Sphingobacteriales bacterium]TAF78706.1 MAG: Asp-tRNA(Asn)/Glu-tRNA(Gln) amidotransferase subunit GatB [Sphingobacteriales bacterium]
MLVNLKEIDKYEAVIGLEVHVQLSTKSKAFCYDSAQYGSKANNHISPVSLGLPGALPRANEAIVSYAVKLGLAIGSTINKYNFFDRKNYFYADLPKGYQITQDNEPICKGGTVKIRLANGHQKNIILNRIHIEEDAGKSIHDVDENYSLIDLNRAGVSLLEVVTEPMIATGEEAAAYLSELRKLVRYLNICDGNMEEGSMRCDANVSIRLKGDTALGNRCEVKNLNSIKNVQRAIEHEISRQIQLSEAGVYIHQNTLNFDALTGITSVLRSKEMANDYRYFPEPDLLPLHLSDEYIEAIKQTMPALPEALYQQFICQFGLPAYDALVLTADKEMAYYFLSLTALVSNYKAASNWVMGTIRSYLNENNIGFDKFPISAQQMALLINKVETGEINNNQAKDKVFVALLKHPTQNINELLKQLNVLIETSTSTIDGFIITAINKFPDKVKEYNTGKKGVLGLFMGEVMKISGGKIDPKSANKLLVQQLEKLK